MKLLFILLFAFANMHGFGQTTLKIFDGNFEQALDLAHKVDKDIFLITKSLTCHVFEKFETGLTSDLESVKFLNETFIVYEYDKDKTTEKEDKLMKNYYHSWRGFPQLYFIDKDENLISDITYPLKIEHDKHLEIWKDYKNIESNWKSIKALKNRKTIDYNGLNEFLIYRQVKYSSFYLIQISIVIDKYFKNLDTTQYHSNQNWSLIQNYVTIYSNPDIFDLVAKHKNDFQRNHGDSIITDYLLSNYQQFINWRKPEKVDKLAEKYPYNSVPEAIQAIEIYRRIKKMQTMFKPIDS